jgi:NADP-dependent 3-hydroxy acid dehydrogenase YdfG
MYESPTARTLTARRPRRAPPQSSFDAHSRRDQDNVILSGQQAPDGPVVLVTGGLSGIGAATARAFAALHAQLVLADLRLDGADATIAAVAAAGGHAEAVEVDVRDAAAIGRVTDDAAARLGRLDALVVNAGVADQSTADAGDPERWRLVVETNVLGALYTVRAALPHMRARETGHIFLVASVSGRETYVGEPAYIASKWAIVGFGHALRQEVMDAGIRVTLVEPGLVDTPLTRGAPAVRPLLEAIEPLTPDDVAAAIVYAFTQPAHALVSELTIRPLRQRLSEGV